MAIFSIDEFRSTILNAGVSRPNRFEVILTAPPCITNAVLETKGAPNQSRPPDFNSASTGDDRLVSLMCEQAALPMSRINTSSQRLFGPAEFFPAGIDYGGDNFSLGFYVDRSMRVKKFFDTWVDGIVDRKTATISYRKNFLTNMTINQLDEADNINYTARFIDVFPTAVQAMNLDMGLASQAAKLQVTFCYRRWEWDHSQGTPQPARPPTRATPRANTQQNDTTYNNGNPMGDVSGYGSGW